MIREVNKLVYEEEVGWKVGKYFFERALEWRIFRVGRRNCGEERREEDL